MSTTTIEKINIIPQPREYTAAEAEKAAMRGALALTRHFEGSMGWVDMVDVDTLYLFDPDRCILGQVFGGYNTGLEKLRLDEKTAIANGFDTPAPTHLQFAFLLNAWVCLILDLRRACKRVVLDGDLASICGEPLPCPIHERASNG